MKRICLLIYTFLSVSLLSEAQDPHFSQFFASPLTLNPALTGKFDGTLRVAGNYRDQWPAFNNVYTTQTLSIDFGIMRKKIPENDVWGVGILALSDKAAGGILTNNYIGLSTSYHKSLDENGFNSIGVGFQGTYGQKRLDWTKLIFSDQLTPFGYDISIPSADISTMNVSNINILDINAGLIYSTSSNGRNNFYVGASQYHINKPKESFKGGTWNVAPRTTISAGGYFPVSDMLTLHTSGIFQSQAQSTETTIGAALSANLTETDGSNPSQIYFGTWLRTSDAIIPYLGLEFSGMRIGASYDINTSNLKSGSQSRGGMELSLIYIKRPPDQKGIPCPKF